MPVADFTPEFKRTADNDFDRLKLKLNEKARIVLLEKPTYAWVHTLRAPKIVSGRAVKVEKKRGGETIMDFDMDFIGRPLCLGDEGILHDDGVDPKNCPVCKRAKEADEVLPPERRFAVNVIRYGLQRDGATLTDPFSCTSVVWSFPESTYNKLYGIAMEYKNRGGLVGLDLLLGPCQAPEAFQKFEIMPGSESVWNLDDKLTDVVTKTFQNNRVENLEGACGRRTELRWLKDDLQKIADRWKVAQGVGDAPDYTGSDGASLSVGLENLLNTPTTTTGNPAMVTTYGQGQMTSVAPAVDAEPAKPAESTNFQSLLSSLNIGQN